MIGEAPMAFFLKQAGRSIGFEINPAGKTEEEVKGQVLYSFQQPLSSCH